MNADEYPDVVEVQMLLGRTTGIASTERVKLAARSLGWPERRIGPRTLAATLLHFENSAPAAPPEGTDAP